MLLFLWGEDDKLLVGGGVHSHLYAMTDENASKSFRHFVGMTGNAKIEVVSEKRVKLDAQHTAFGQEGTMALDGGEEGSWCLDVAEDYRFAEHGTHLGATDIESVHMLCQPGQGYVGLGGGKTVSQTCSVGIQQQVVASAHFLYVLYFLLGVEHAQFSRHGDVDHAWQYHVGICLVGQKGRHVPVYPLCCEFASFGGNYQNLMSVGLNGTRFVHVNMCRFCGNDTFTSQQEGVDDGLVCLRSAYQEEDVGLGATNGLSYLLLGTCRVWVGTIAGGLVVVFRYQA